MWSLKQSKNQSALGAEQPQLPAMSSGSVSRSPAPDPYADPECVLYSLRGESFVGATARDEGSHESSLAERISRRAVARAAVRTIDRPCDRSD